MASAGWQAVTRMVSVPPSCGPSATGDLSECDTQMGCQDGSAWWCRTDRGDEDDGGGGGGGSGVADLAVGNSRGS